METTLKLVKTRNETATRTNIEKKLPKTLQRNKETSEEIKRRMTTRKMQDA